MELEVDPRVRTLLETSSRWHTLVHRAEVGSTQDVALGMLRDGLAPGLVVVADAQTAGRGRGGRAWRDAVSGRRGPANLAVTASVACPEQRAELVSLAAGLAVAHAYRGAGASPRLKWPNDVLLGDRKAAGILVERHLLGDGPGVLLVGCGLDLDWRGIERDDEAAGWTSLAEEVGDDVDRGAVLVELLGRLDVLVAQVSAEPERLLDRYRTVCATLGSQVRVSMPGGRSVAGNAVEIDGNGRLVVSEEGRREVVAAGEVVHVRPG